MVLATRGRVSSIAKFGYSSRSAFVRAKCDLPSDSNVIYALYGSTTVELNSEGTTMMNSVLDVRF
jgi:hypothetical protein